MVDIHVVWVGDDVGHALVVGYMHRHWVGECLTHTSECIVCHVVAVLVEVEWLTTIDVFTSVAVTLSILFGRIDFPSTTKNWECTFLDGWYVETYGFEWQHEFRLFEFTDNRSTAEELDANVDDVFLYTCLKLCTVGIALGVSILVDSRHIAVALQCVDIGSYRHIERGLLNRYLARDVEVQLIVWNAHHSGLVNDCTKWHFCVNSIISS